MSRVTIQELRNGIVEFRGQMGDSTLAPEQRRFEFSKLNQTYLNVDVDDPEFETVAEQYIATSIEYVQRMCLMGLAHEL